MTVFSICRVAGSHSKKDSRTGGRQSLFGGVAFEARPRAKDGIYTWRRVRVFGPRFWAQYIPDVPSAELVEVSGDLEYVPYLRHGDEAKLSPVQLLAEVLR